MRIVFDNLVDVKTGKPVEVEINVDDVVGLADTGERASLAGQRFRAMFSRE